MHELIACDGCAVFQSPFMMKTMGKVTTNTLLLHAPFLVLHQMESSVSVVFDFNASLRDVAPVSPMMLSVDLMRMEKSELQTSVIYLLFLLSSPLRSSFTSTVFDFSTSTIDVASVSPM